MIAMGIEEHLALVRARYVESQAMVQRAEKHIPLGSQTFSKSRIQYPSNAAPLFLDRGKGSHVWDIDGNEYVDFVNGLLPVILGYDDPDVTHAVKEQLAKGVSFSLATTLEIELAELLAEIIPCAEMTRFGKNGSDATSAAIRVARAYTGRDHVAVCGYHGWHDWYIGSTTRNKGVPKAVCDLTHTFTYNNLDSLKALLDANPDQFAAVIMEPMNTAEPAPGFLEGVRDLTHANGALFIFDEIITGFRYHIGGAQTLFGVVPDLASFGKSMGNGFPIAAVVGKAKYMREMEDIFYSGTFGGEALSLVASIATIHKMQREPVQEHIKAMGQLILKNARELIAKHGLGECVSICGHPSWTLFQFRDAPTATLWEIKSLYLQETMARGILSGGTHDMCYCHSPADVAQLAEAQDAAFGVITQALGSGNIRDYLAGPPIEPLFRVR